MIFGPPTSTNRLALTSWRELVVSPRSLSADERAHERRRARHVIVDTENTPR
jgi:hypothetical protein